MHWVRKGLGPVIYRVLIYLFFEIHFPGSEINGVFVFESETELQRIQSRISDNESTAGENSSNSQAQLLWDEASLIKFALWAKVSQRPRSDRLS